MARLAGRAPAGEILAREVLADVRRGDAELAGEQVPVEQRDSFGGCVLTARLDLVRVAPARRPGYDDSAVWLAPAFRAAELNPLRPGRRLTVRLASVGYMTYS